VSTSGNMRPSRPKNVQIPVVVAPQIARELKALSVKTRISQQSFLREALTDLLAKYAQVRT
jgi:hypothetical protein